MVLGNVDLVNLAGRQFLAELGDGAYHTEIVGADGTGKGVADKEIADKHGDMVVPRVVDGVVAATLLGLVDNVIVYQRGVVEQFHRRCAAEHTVRHLGAEKLGAEHNDYRAYLLAFCFQILVYNLIEQRTIA